MNTRSSIVGATESGSDRREFLTRAARTLGAVTVAAPLFADKAAGATLRFDRTAARTRTVQMWTQAYGDPKTFNAFIAKTTAAFKRQTGVTVNWDVVQWASAQQKWDLAMSKGQVPDVADVFFLQSRVVQGRGKWGPMDLTKLVKSGAFGNWNRYVPVARQEAQYKGGIYGLPWRIDIRALVYRDDLWSPPPATVTAFERGGSKVLDNTNVTAAASTFGFAHTSLKALGAMWGVQPLTANLQSSALLDRRWRQALTWAQDMVDKKLLLADAVIDSQAPPYDNILNGTIAAFIGGNAGVIPVAKSSAPSVVGSLKSGLIPAVSGSNHYGTASTAQFSIFENTEAPTESAKWLAYLTSPSVALQLARVTGLDSSDTAVQARMADSFRKPFYRQSRTAFNIDQPTPAWGELVAAPEGPLVKLAVNVFSGSDVAKELASANKAVNKILAKYR